MCGIAGGFWHADHPSLKLKMEAALHSLRNRGPNDKGSDFYRLEAGVLCLGHTRLSIIDLSNGGHQPMNAFDQASSIIFNGEIYNYKEIRKELEGLGRVFRTDSDTEVLLEAWRQWGARCLSRLVGMFSFVFYDRIHNTLTCVRDAFGIKPFFYSKSASSFIFASETAAISCLIGGSRDVNWQRAYDYLSHGYMDNCDETFFSGISRLMPGHLMVVDLRTGNVSEPEPWWRPDIREKNCISFQDAAEVLRERFLDSLKLHLRSDVPIGAALSGGIDSSAIVCGIRHLESDVPIETFSYVAEESALSEEVWIDCVNKTVGAVSHKARPSAYDLKSDIDDMIASQGEPFSSTSIYAQYCIFRLAKENGITVTLEGQGADETLAGYNGYPGPRARSLIESHGVMSAVRFLNEWSKWPGRSFSDGLKRLLAEYSHGDVYAAMRYLQGRRRAPSWLNQKAFLDANVTCEFPRDRPEMTAVGRRTVAEMALSLTRRGIPGLLRYSDRNSMRFSIESRVPFLTIGLAEFLLALPEEYLISTTGETKSIFRQAMRGIVPNNVLDRKDKIGFVTPELTWLRDLSSEARGWIQDGLPAAYFYKSLILREFDLVIDGRQPFSLQLWRWINFARWHQLFVN